MRPQSPPDSWKADIMTSVAESSANRGATVTCFLFKQYLIFTIAPRAQELVVGAYVNH